MAGQRVFTNSFDPNIRELGISNKLQKGVDGYG